MIYSTKPYKEGGKSGVVLPTMSVIIPPLSKAIHRSE